MGLEGVKAEIEKHAAVEIAKIASDTSQIIKDLEQESNKKITVSKTAHTQDLVLAKEKSDAITKNEIESEALHLLLAEKQRLISQAVDEAKVHLQKKSKTILPKLLKRAKQDITVDCVICSKADAKMLGDEKFKYKDIGGGLQAQNKDGTVSVDYCFDTVLNSIKEKQTREIAKVLFE